MDFRFVPTSARGEKAKFKGYLMLSPVHFADRLRYTAECGFQTDESGQTKVDPKNLSPLIKAVELTQKHIKEVDIVKVKEGTKYASYDDLSYDPDTSEILLEVAGLILRGFKPEKN